MRREDNEANIILKVLPLTMIGVSLIIIASIMWVIHDRYPNELRVQDYMSFGAPAAGALLSGIMPFVVIYITNAYNKMDRERNMEIIEEDRRIAKEKYEEEKLNSVRPTLTFLDCEFADNAIRFTVKNIGVGPAINIKVYDKNDVLCLCEFVDLGIGDTYSIVIEDLTEILLNFKEGISITDYREFLLNIKCTDIYNKKEYHQKICIIYNRHKSEAVLRKLIV